MVGDREVEGWVSRNPFLMRHGTEIFKCGTEIFIRVIKCTYLSIHQKNTDQIK